jgi:hypothetical protein
MSALRRTFRLEKRASAKKALRRTNADPRRPKPQTLISARNLLGCHGISSVKCGLGRPSTGSALHHLVTAVSVKKALKGLLQSLVARHSGAHRRREPGMTDKFGDALRTHSDKMRSGGRLPHCAGDIVKE